MGKALRWVGIAVGWTLHVGAGGAVVALWTLKARGHLPGWCISDVVLATLGVLLVAFAGCGLWLTLKEGD